MDENTILDDVVENNEIKDDDLIIEDISKEEWCLDEDMFKDENIAETIKKYNYDYKYLMRELSLYLSYDELLEILNLSGVSMSEYLSPTYDTFEKVRNYIINVRTIDEKGE